MSRRNLDFRPAEKGVSSKRLSRARSGVVVSVGLFLLLPPLSGQQAARPWTVKILERLLVPFRSNPFSQSSLSRCRLGLASCRSSKSPAPLDKNARPGFQPEDSGYTAVLEVRADFRGPLAHHWLQLDTPQGEMTFGFGPATLPFIDSGQVSLQDLYGNTKWISGMHPLPWLALPPVRYHYARNPGEGRIVGEPVLLSAAQSDVLINKMLHMKLVGPYIPFFHDCRTFTCAARASAQGRSTLPCYLLFKGYW